MNILVLSTFPISKPAHGGQLRTHHIVNYYKKCGYSVDVIGVLGSPSYESECGFLPTPSLEEFNSIVKNSFLIEDYAIGKLYEKDEYLNRLINLIPKIPDIIHVELPWLFSFAKIYAKKCLVRPKIIYSSENIESILKREIYSTFFNSEQTNYIEKKINSIELYALKEADAIYCVSENNYNYIKKYTSKPLYLIPNGVEDWFSEDADKNTVQLITHGKQFALFCGSAHPPNIKGFFEIFGNGFGSLNKDQKLVIAGSCCDCIHSHPFLARSAKLADHTILTGQISKSVLNALLKMAHCIVLPITQGEGTNLKTAEAIWSGKYIVSTKTAMRGFEIFMHDEGIFIAEDAGDFKRKLRYVMNLPPLHISNNEREKRKKILWENCLYPIKYAIQKLSQNS